MISEIEVSNYQSLGSLVVKPGRFTVITGRTGAGKSALIRALHALAFNVRGTRDIMYGEKTFTVSMAGSEDDRDQHDASNFWQATIRRGVKDSYQLAVGINQKTYTKLQGKVPEAVSDTLRLGEINFATQFDRPFLLDSTGGDVARVLGRLTNVTLLFRAAQEANRRRLAVNAELKTRQADLALLEQQIEQYATLGDELAAVRQAEGSLETLRDLGQRSERLDYVLKSLGFARDYLASLKTPPEPPSLDKLEELARTRMRLHARIAQLDDAWLALAGRARQETSAAALEAACQQELDEYVGQWGVCPACGQPVQKISRPLGGAMSITMYDSTEPAACPAGGGLYAAYVDGYGGYTETVALHGAAKSVSISVGNNDADVADVETGAMSPSDLPGWIARQQARGIARPVVYSAQGTWSACRDAVGGANVSYWIANPGGSGTISGADAVQNVWESSWDSSEVQPSFPFYPGAPVTPPKPPVTPPTPPPSWTYPKPQSLRAVGGHMAVELSWAAPSLAAGEPAVDHYLVFIYKGVNAARANLVLGYPTPVSATSMADGNLAADTEYTAHVVASGPVNTRQGKFVYATASFTTGA